MVKTCPSSSLSAWGGRERCFITIPSFISHTSTLLQFQTFKDASMVWFCVNAKPSLWEGLGGPLHHIHIIHYRHTLKRPLPPSPSPTERERCFGTMPNLIPYISALLLFQTFKDISLFWSCELASPPLGDLGGCTFLFRLILRLF